MRAITRFSVVTILILASAHAFAQPAPTIAEIQGAGHISPLKRENVEGVIGVVTAVAPGIGFYMESLNPDSDPATSEGIYVAGLRMPRIAIGDHVSVTGRVDEKYPGGPSSGNLPITTILRARVEVTSSGNPLPPPVVIGIGGLRVPGERIAEYAGGLVYENEFNPALNALDLYESVEGMRVTLNNAVSVGTVHTSYGEIWVLPDNGAGGSVRTARGGIAVREGDFNPERILIDYLETPSIFDQNPVVLPVVGDTFTGPIVGVMSYSFGNYKLLPSEQLPPIRRENLPRQHVEPNADPAVLSVAAFNVYNLSARDESAKFTDLAQTIVTGLGAPDIVVLSEVQDSDGTLNTEDTESTATVDSLLRAIAATGGPADYAYADIAPERNRDGGAPGGNIRVGFLYRESRVDLATRPGGDATTSATAVTDEGRVAISPSPARIDPQNRAFSSSRKPIVAEFNFRDRQLFVVGNHFNSKGGDGYLFGQVQPPTFSSEGRRGLQAEAVRLFVEEIQEIDPDAFVIVAGDLNDFAFSGALTELRGNGVLLNLASELLPESEIYSYIYEGNSQALDHILVTPALYESADTTVEYVHRYSEYLYEERWSDHDPVIARFRFR